jgi:hypothetical protein
MKRVSKDFLSKFRQDVHQKGEDLKRLCLVAAEESALLAGTPVKTYKTCGKANCKCSVGGDHRHGPYMAVQIRKDGAQRNLTLKKTEAHFFEMAREYQRQMSNREKIISLQEELLQKVDKMIEARVIWNKK